MKEIILTVDSNGATKIQTKGYKGKSCMNASKFLEDALGEGKDVQYTPEYYEYDGSRAASIQQAKQK